MRRSAVYAITVIAISSSLYAAGHEPRRYRRFAAPINAAATPGSAEYRGSLHRKDAAAFSGAIESADAFRAPEKKASRVYEGPSSVVDFGSDDIEIGVSHERALGTASESDNKDAVDVRAALIRPANGSTLGAVERFEWTQGLSPQMYWLWLGSCRDCTDIADTGLGLSRSFTASLPTDGRTLYATLFTLHDGEWYWFDYTFRAGNSAGSKAELVSPAYGATLAANQTFRWSPGSNVIEYYLWIGSCQDCTDILDESQGLNLSKTVSLPEDGRTIFVTLFSYVSGNWQWVDYQFRATSRRNSGGPVSITVANRLAWPVNISVNGAVVGSVPAFETRTHSDHMSTLQVEWELIAPTLNGRALGERMGGKFAAISSPAGDYRFEIDNRVAEAWYFAPLITNRTGVGLLIEVNGGLQSQNRCNCTAPTGSTEVGTGYYRLFSNSNVRLWRADSNYTGRYRFWGTDADGRIAGGKLTDHVEAGPGILRITATTAP